MFVDIAKTAIKPGGGPTVYTATTSGKTGRTGLTLEIEHNHPGSVSETFRVFVDGRLRAGWRTLEQATDHAERIGVNPPNTDKEGTS